MAGLTRQHFEEIAKILNDEYKTIISSKGDTRFKALCERFADFLQNHNPLFNRERFLKACLE